jgi:hypothetical protein
MEKVEIKNLLAGFDISNEMHRFDLVSEFLKQTGKQLYIKKLINESPSAEDIKMFADKLVEFKEFTDKLCTLSATKA